MYRKWNYNWGNVDLDEKDNKLRIVSEISLEEFRDKYSSMIDVYLKKDSMKFLKKSFNNEGQEIKIKKDDAVNDIILLFDKIQEEEEGKPAIVAIESSYEPGETFEGTERLIDKQSMYKIYIKENVDVEADHEGNPKESELTGALKIANLSEKDRIWDLDVILDGIENTSLSEDDAKIHLKELNPEADYSINYSIDTEKVQTPPLKITEKINTWTETDEENNTYILNKESDTEFTIILENKSDGPVTDVEIIKDFPESFRNIKKNSLDAGDIDINDNRVIWKISEILQDSQLALKLSGYVIPESTDPIQTGKINAKYVLRAGTFSGIGMKSADGFSRNIFKVNKDEKEKLPDNWDCNFIFQNRSEFPMLLKNVDILSRDVDTDKMLATYEPTVLVPPGESWQSEMWELESEEVPTFGKRVLFTLIPDLNKTLSASISLMPIDLYVLSFKGEKRYSETEIPSFRIIPIKAVNKIWSEGPVDIQSFIFEDEVPKDFRPPDPQDIKLFINDNEISPDNFEAKISPDFDPEAEEYPDVHTILLNMKNVPEVVEKGSPIEIRLEYEMSSIQARPDMQYRGDCNFKAYTIPEGPEIELVPEEILTTPIKVIHVRRKESVAKAIFPGSEEDEYEILLTYTNRGNQVIDEKIIADQIPENFELLSMDPEGEIEELEKGMRIIWKIKEIDPEQEAEIVYVIKGSGEYKAGDTEILAKD
ncbi:MAG: hypothetical protein EU549_05165 [Promethearchaeota archaeon]|nr:MAG: hypothetical protein EU549_05165 [Candidatus Lokiarchaeota archaeon]